MIEEARASFQEHGLVQAVRGRDDDAIFQWLADAISYQGVSDRVARTYIEEHGAISAEDIRVGLTQSCVCPKLTSYWHFQGCGYRKVARTCSQPQSLPACPLPRHELRNGNLNQAAYHLFLFMRDVAGEILWAGWTGASKLLTQVVVEPAPGGCAVLWSSRCAMCTVSRTRS
jgi:hypothetical protein